VVTTDDNGWSDGGKATQGIHRQCLVIGTGSSMIEQVASMDDRIGSEVFRNVLDRRDCYLMVRSP
jgi:hypothetical protein